MTKTAEKPKPAPYFHLALGIALHHQDLGMRYSTEASSGQGSYVKQSILDEKQRVIARVVSFPTPDKVEGLAALATAPGVDARDAKVRQDGLHVQILHRDYEKRVMDAFKEVEHDLGSATYETHYHIIPQRAPEQKPGILSFLSYAFAR
jgi:hypothetical protein